MKKMLLCSLMCLCSFSTTLFARDIVGFWNTINEKTNKPESIVAVYEYKDKYYGRIVATINKQGVVDDSIDAPKDRAPGVIGNPYYSGLDIIWDLEKEGSKYTDGEILDPEHGKVYDAELWIEGDKLIVRGEILFIGRNQAWLPTEESRFSNFTKPDLTKLVPSIPKVK